MEAKLDSARNVPRKRKLCNVMEASEMEDDPQLHRMDSEDQTKKQNHSEIEKRRRDKMNLYITELSSLVPMCNAMARKLDKLTVLRMAVQHMKTLRGSINSYAEGLYKPSFLSDEELKHLILGAAEGFLFVVSCDRGRMLFVSESVSQVLNYSQNDLLGQSWFDILHPKDIAKVKEQLSSSDLSPKERLIDAKTMMPVKTDIPQTQVRLCPGARRSFFCRMKCKVSSSVKEEADTTTGMHRKRKSHHSDRRYCVIHCTGYLKSWAPANLSIDIENDSDSDCNLSCLVAVGQVQHCLPNPIPKDGIELRTVEFTSRHAVDGKFIYVDQRAFLMLGYLPQELQGTSCYEYFHQDDIMHLAEFHREVLQRQERLTSAVYRFRKKEGNFAFLTSKWKTFRNPWTKELEYITSINTLVPVVDTGLVESSNSAREEIMTSNSNSLDAVLSYLPSSGNLGDVPRLCGTKVGAGKIGRQIAEEVLERHRMQEAVYSNVAPAGNNNFVTPQGAISNVQKDRYYSRTYNPKRDSQHTFDNDLLASSPSSNSTSSQYMPQLIHHQSQLNDAVNLQEMDSVIGREMLQASYQSNSNEGNDEAAMAVIMSLLEADAGLGGPVDFSGLPWPLP